MAVVVRHDVDIHFIVAGKNRWIDHVRGHHFIGHAEGAALRIGALRLLFVLAEQIGDRRVGAIDDGIHLAVVLHVDFLGEVRGDQSEFRPARAKADLGGFGVEINVHGTGGVVNASAHENHFLGDGHNVRREHDGEREVRHGAAAIHRHFVRVGANGADDEVRGWLGLRLDLREAVVGRRQRGQFVAARGIFREASQISFVSQRSRAKHLVAHLRFSLGVEQRFLRAHKHRNFRAAHDFQQAQRVGGFLLGPHVAAHGANSQQIDVVRLQEHQRRNRIRGERAAVVLVVN